MLKLLSFSLLILHCHCIPVIEVGKGGVQQKVDLTNGVSISRGISGISSLGSLGVGGVRVAGFGSSLGGLQTVGVQPIGVQSIGVQPIGVQTVGVQPVAGIGLSSVGVRPGFGVGLTSFGGLRTNALNLGVSQVGVSPVGLGGLGVVQAVRPAVQAVAVQPAVGINTVGINALKFGIGQRVGVSQQVVPVSAAIQQVGRTVEYRPVPYNDEPIVPQVVEVEPSDIPLRIHFKSRSSSIQLSQEHIPGEPGTIEQTQSHDEPSKVVHQVVKPVIQEVREVITPYRQVVQEVQPVVESVHTVVAKGEGGRAQYVAQPFVQNVQSIQTVGAVRPAIAVAQPVAVSQAFKQVSQPFITKSFQSIAQPVVGFGGVRAVGIQQPLSVAFAQQPAAVGFGGIRAVGIQQPLSVAFAQQPAAVGFGGIRTVGIQQPLSVAVAQPALAVGGLRSGSFVSTSGLGSGLLDTTGSVSGLIGSGISGVRTIGTGQSFFTKTQTIPQSVAYQTKTNYESDIDESD